MVEAFKKPRGEESEKERGETNFLELIPGFFSKLPPQIIEKIGSGITANFGRIIKENIYRFLKNSNNLSLEKREILKRILLLVEEVKTSLEKALREISILYANPLVQEALATGGLNPITRNVFEGLSEAWEKYKISREKGNTLILYGIILAALFGLLLIAAGVVGFGNFGIGRAHEIKQLEEVFKRGTGGQ